MAIQKIQYEDKETLYNLTSIQNKNKCTADDLNEIKQVVNNNADELANLHPSSEEIYSTTEQVVGKWVDNRNVYRKVIMPNNTGSGTQSFNHGISNLDRVIRCDIGAADSAYFNESKGQYTFPRMSADGYNIGLSRINDTTVEYYVPTVFSNRIYDVICILTYIKTAD